MQLIVYFELSPYLTTITKQGKDEFPTAEVTADRVLQ
jgi:hypothetical protein